VDISISRYPWIATTKDFSVAQEYNLNEAKLEIVVIDLNKVSAIKKFLIYEEVSIYKYVEQSAIVGIIP